MNLLKGKQIPVAATLSMETDKIRDQIKLLIEKANKAELHEFANGFSILADGASRMSVELDSAARTTYCAALRGEQLPS